MERGREREREAVSLLPITQRSCPHATPPCVQAVVNDGPAFNLPSAPRQHPIGSSLDFDLQTLELGFTSRCNTYCLCDPGQTTSPL